MLNLDKWTQHLARRVAQASSRRGFLARVGAVLVGGGALPLLPVARAVGADTRPAAAGVDDPTTCEYWRHCGMDGYLCSCCGGSHLACPPGTEPAAITWVGTCRNPGDGKDYVISYNDCCGKSICGRCLCNRNEGEEPMYRPGRANDIDWCLGVKSNAYHCTTALVIGVAAGPSGHR